MADIPIIGQNALSEACPFCTREAQAECDDPNCHYAKKAAAEFEAATNRGLTLSEYLGFAIQTAIYPSSNLDKLRSQPDDQQVEFGLDWSGLSYTTLGLAGEAGEVANKVKKFIRDGASAEKVEELVGEIGDVFWYAVMLCFELGVNPDDILMANIFKLQARFANDTIQGEGDDR